MEAVGLWARGEVGFQGWASLHPLWDSGRSAVTAGLAKPEGNWRSSPAPASRLPRSLFQRQAAGPVSRPPSDRRRVHVCTKRPMPKPPMHKHTATNETIVPFPSRSHFLPLEFLTSSIGGVCSGDGVSSRSFRFSLERTSCQTTYQLDRQIAPVRLVRGIPELQQKRVETLEKKV